MRVLSMFDGISCGRVALDRLGVEPEVYYASEIDKYAERVSEDNYPDIIRLGDAFGVEEWNLGPIDLLLGGSPCTHWSIAQKNNRETESSGIGWELFSLYVKAIEKHKPRYFLYENVKGMSGAIRAEITRSLGVEPILINSALVSAQTRERLYWTNIPGVEQPEDKGVLLRDIMLDGSKTPKAAWYSCHYDTISNEESGVVAILDINSLDMNRRVYGRMGKSPTLTTCLGGHRQAKVMQNGTPRRLQPLEYARLQTLPDDYCKAVSDTQAYKAIGNGWTVDVIAHILKNIKEASG